MRLTDAQVAWNKKAREYEALRAEISRTVDRSKILDKKCPAAAKIMRDATTKLVDQAIKVAEELSKMEGPSD